MSGRIQLPALTGLRFFAAFSILLAHACDGNGGFQDYMGVRAYGGLMAMYGMPLFFVLSGFVVHYNYSSLFSHRSLRTAVAEFAAARFARLFPLYFFFLIVALLADSFFTYADNRPDILRDAAIYYPTLSQSWVFVTWNGTLMAATLFGIAWSISTEAFFYVAYIPMVFLFARMTRPITVLCVGVLYMIVVTIALCAAVDVGLDPLGLFSRWLFYYSPYIRMFEFFLGCLAAHFFILVSQRPVSRIEMKVGRIALGAALAFLVVFGALRMNLIATPINGMVNHLSENFLFAPAFAILMFCASRYDTAFSRFLASAPVVQLGEMSYSIYLVHLWVFRLFNHPPQPLTIFWGTEVAARIIVSMGLSLAVAYGTYRTIEMPCRRWVRHALHISNKVQGAALQAA